MLTPDEIAARVEIPDLLMRYGRGVDRCDRDLIRSAFHEGAIINQGVFAGTEEEWADSVMQRSEGKALVGQHHITNISMVIDGDTAKVESYFLIFYPIFDDESGEETMAVNGGRFLDHVARRGGRWGITARQVVMDWTRDRLAGVPLVRPFVQGIAGRADVSVAFFEEPAPAADGEAVM